MVNWAEKMGKVKISEWLWRFLASVMLISVGWTMWIFYQLNPTPLITAAAFEAAAKAKSKAQQNTHGVISPATGAEPSAVPAAPAAAASETPREPPVNVEKLKLSDSIAPPAPDAKQ
ncbi:MAG: hypothetical protein ABI654_16335 [Betaproteobacteria bacterium]